MELGSDGGNGVQFASSRTFSRANVYVMPAARWLGKRNAVAIIITAKQQSIQLIHSSIQRATEQCCALRFNSYHEERNEY